MDSSGKYIRIIQGSFFDVSFFVGLVLAMFGLWSRKPGKTVQPDGPELSRESCFCFQSLEVVHGRIQQAGSSKTPPASGCHLVER